MKSFVSNSSLILIVLISSLTLNSCRDENVNADKKFQRESILTFLLLPRFEPIASCRNAYVEAQVCLIESRSFPLVSANEQTISAVLSDGSVQNYTDLCNQTKVSQTFRNHTDQAFACNFNCQNTYWRTLSSSNLTACSNNTFSDLWNNSVQDRGLQRCIQSCFQLTGSPIATSPKIELYLLYSTLE